MYGEAKNPAQQAAIAIAKKEKGIKEDSSEDYKEFFKAALKKFGVSSPGELEGDKEKQFYNYVDANWKGKDESEEMNESAVDMSDYDENWEDHVLADEEPSEEELDHFMDSICDDDVYDLYDEEELAIVDEEDGEEVPEDEEEKGLDEEKIMEVLSRAERIKAKFRIRKTKAKRERAAKIALKRFSNVKTINKRSRRLAVKLLKKRFLKGRDPSKLSVGEKERLEKIVQSRKQLIGRLAMRLAPRVRKLEKTRLSHSKYTKD